MNGRSEGDSWHKLSARENSGAIDSWKEYLSGRLFKGGVMIGVLAPQPLGEVPWDWYDDEGELLPMHRTDDGDIRLPEVFNGKIVVGIEGDTLIGNLQPIDDRSTYWLGSLSPKAIHAALQSLDWNTFDTDKVLLGLQGMLNGLHTVRVAYADVLLATYGQFNQPQGVHSIFVDGKSLAKIFNGEEVSQSGQGFYDDEVGLLEDRWWFNARARGSVAISIKRPGMAELEWYEAVACWIDGQASSPPAWHAI